MQTVSHLYCSCISSINPYSMSYDCRLISRVVSPTIQCFNDGSEILLLSARKYGLGREANIANNQIYDSYPSLSSDLGIEDRENSQASSHLNLRWAKRILQSASIQSTQMANYGKLLFHLECWFPRKYLAYPFMKQNIVLCVYGKSQSPST